jgi:hypothetical protein
MARIVRAHEARVSPQRARDVRITSARCPHSIHHRHIRPLRSIAEVGRMFVRRWCAVVLIVLSVVSRARGAQPQACVTGIPANIDAGVFGRDVVALAVRSETFRSQCDRLAQTPRVRVTLAIVSSLPSGRAQTVMHRFASGAMTANVEILFGENYRELLAHELEHILEQVDGVDLRLEAAAGRAWLLPGGAFETRRAFVTGVQVLREVESTLAHGPAAVHATR